MRRLPYAIALCIWSVHEAAVAWDWPLAWAIPGLILSLAVGYLGFRWLFDARREHQALERRVRMIEMRQVLDDAGWTEEGS